MIRKIVVLIGIFLISISIVTGILGVLTWQIVSIVVASIAAITGLIQNYLPREKMGTRKEEAPVEGKTILKETFRVGVDGQSNDFQLRKGERVRGRVESDNTIDVYVVDKNNFQKWEREKSFDYVWGTESIFETHIDFEAPKRAMWYILFEKHGRESARVKVDIYRVSSQS